MEQNQEVTSFTTKKGREEEEEEEESQETRWMSCGVVVKSVPRFSRAQAFSPCLVFCSWWIRKANFAASQDAFHNAPTQWCFVADSDRFPV